MGIEKALEFFQSLPKFDPANTQTYDALCHCGKVQWSVTLSPALEQQKVVSCNCSICFRNGYLLVYPSREHVVVKSGEESLRTYQFGTKGNLHKFCSTCGSSVFFDPRMKELYGLEMDLMGINVRMFKGVNTKKLELVEVNGWEEWPFVNDTDYLK